jgi:hypothetical protein
MRRSNAIKNAHFPTEFLCNFIYLIALDVHLMQIKIYCCKSNEHHIKVYITYYFDCTLLNIYSIRKYLKRMLQTLKNAYFMYA